MNDTLNGSTLWRGGDPLLLASKSRARVDLLLRAGIPVVIQPSDIDERAAETGFRSLHGSASAIAAALAQAKAASIGTSRPNQLVLGADQTLECDGQRLHKPADLSAAAGQLELLSGKAHYLHSACCIFINGNLVFATVSSAKLTMRVMSRSFISAYISAAGSSILDCVGAYQLEQLGVHLFEWVEGDHATILGLPLFPLLTFLRDHGSIAT